MRFSPSDSLVSIHIRDRNGRYSLALVQTLAKLHGAELKLTSRIGEGAVATLVFPPERTLRAAAETKTASTADD